MKKKIIRLIASALILVCVCCLLVSCAPSGTYDGDLYTFEFKSGKNVHVVSKITGGAYDGTYEIGKDENNKDIITFTFEGVLSATLGGSHSYVQEKNYIEISGAKYIKK